MLPDFSINNNSPSSFLKPAKIDNVIVYIDAKDRIEYISKNKGVEYKYFGDFNLVEILGRDVDHYEICFYIAPTNSSDAETSNLEQWNIIQTSLLNPLGLLLTLPDYPPLYAVAVPNQDIKLVKHRGWYKVNVVFTNAPLLLTNNRQPASNLNLVTAERGNEASLLQKGLVFKNNVYEKIQQFAGKVDEVNNLMSGIAGNISSVQGITNLVNNALSTIPANINNLTNSIQATTNALIDIPNNIANFTAAFQNSIDAFVNVFNTPNATVDGLANVGTSVSAHAIRENDSQTAIDIQNNTNLFNGIVAIECLINIYNQVEQITFITVAQVSALVSTERTIYNSVVEKGLVDTNLDQMRNAFYIIVRRLLANAVGINVINVAVPTSLANLVYQQNGDLTYYDETRALNKIVNTFAVQGSIQILLN